MLGALAAPVVMVGSDASEVERDCCTFAWTVLVVFAVVAVALALLLRMYLRRRRTARRQPSAHQPGAGWFSDPTRRFGLRYWDGTAWTESVSNGGATEADPVL